MTSKEILKYYLAIGEEVTNPNYLKSVKYQFLDIEEFKKIEDVGRLNQIYWNEILVRAHWSAVTSIYRSNKWIQAMLQADNDLNFLSFSSSLRALIESSGDTVTSLGVVPGTLAEIYHIIKESIAGNQIANIHTSAELENHLLHFVYAHSVNKKDQKEHEIPDTHIAKFNSDYIQKLDNKKDGDVYRLYKTLCQIVHPAALSILYSMGERQAGNVTELGFIEKPDREAIDLLLNSSQDEITTICQYGYNSCLILLKTLNLFDVPALRTPIVDKYSFDHLKVWSNILDKIGKH